MVPTYVPRVNGDGNETAGVPSVQMQAPLGTYLGWNAVRSGFFAGQGCGFQGGWIPFAKTKAERLANFDPRLSLEERYGTHAAYVALVRRAADQAVRDRFLLPEDAARMVQEADASDVLRQAPPASHSTDETVDRTRRLCAHPAVARYRGAASIDDAANFTCTSR
jgi:hypothetical protein